MKPLLKKIYLTLRRCLLRIIAILIFHKRLLNSGVGPDIRKILFIRIDRIGDLVLSTPALRAIKQRFPRSELVVLVSPSNKSILFNNPNVDRIVVYGKEYGLKRRIKILQQLREQDFDLAVDPYADYELNTSLIALLSGAKKRIGFAFYGREVFFNIQSPEVREDQHIVDLSLGILVPLGINACNRQPEVFLTDDEKQWARDWQSERGIGDKPIVGIHPGGYYETQRWPLERFADVANRLIEDGYSDVFLLGGPRDLGLVNRIHSMLEIKAPIYCGDNLREFAALIYTCHILICNNSGPLHMAVALNIPTISTMGPTNKDRWMPIGDIHRVFRRDELPCIGCNLGYCKIRTHDCMRLTTASMVLEAVEDILRARII